MDTQIKQVLGDNVHAVRTMRHIKKVDLCIAAGINRPILDGIEDHRGNIRISTLQALADALDVKASDLLKPGKFSTDDSEPGFPS